MTTGPDRTTAIDAPHYEQARQRLTHEPVIWRMAAEIQPIPLDSIMDANGAALWPFIQQANRVYRDYGGQTETGHIGAVAETIIRILVTNVRNPERLLSMWLPPPEPDGDDVTAVVLGRQDQTSITTPDMMA